MYRLLASQWQLCFHIVSGEPREIRKNDQGEPGGVKISKAFTAPALGCRSTTICLVLIVNRAATFLQDSCTPVLARGSVAHCVLVK